MADLSPVGTAGGSAAGRDSRYATARERGQIILVGGFVIAATLIALALVMNSAIYTQNLATQSDTSGAVDANAYQRAVEHGTADAVVYANDVNDSSDYDDLEANVTENVAAFSDLSTRQAVTRGHVPNVSVVDGTEGSSLTYDGGVEFTNTGVSHAGDDSNNWTIADGVDSTRRFSIGVDDPLSLNVSGNKELHVVADDGSDEWRMNVSETGGDVTIGIYNGTYTECNYTPSNSFWINVTAGTVAGSVCEPLSFAEGIGTYDLRYENTSAIEGNYSLLVDDSSPPSNYGTGDHEEETAIYSTTVDVTYRTSDLYYETEVRVAPGEADD